MGDGAHRTPGISNKQSAREIWSDSAMAVHAGCCRTVIERALRALHCSNQYPHRVRMNPERPFNVAQLVENPACR